MSKLFEYFLLWLEKRGSHKLITRDNKPYLERFYLLKIKQRSVYLHRFWNSDPDEVHDHPWLSFSFILFGGYREHFHDGTFKDRVPGEMAFRDATSLHRIEVPEGREGEAWTLFFTGKRKRDWGFMTKDGWVNAREYISQDSSDVELQGRDYELKGWLFPRRVFLK